MKIQSASTLAATLLLFTGAAIAATGEDETNPQRDRAKAAFERFRSMNGDWVLQSEDEELAPVDNAAEPVRSNFRTTAGGSAVLEIEFVGTEKEMVTVYHMDGDDLALTHYCMAGNAPEMVLQPGDDEDVLQFACRGGANIDCATSMHMHSGRFEFLEDGRVHAVWEMVANGEVTYTADLHMTRD